MKQLLKKDPKSETYHKSKPMETTSHDVQSADIRGFLRFRKNKETSNENSEEDGDVITVGEKADSVEASDRDVMKTNTQDEQMEENEELENDKDKEVSQSTDASEVDANITINNEDELLQGEGVKKRNWWFFRTTVPCIKLDDNGQDSDIADDVCAWIQVIAEYYKKGLSFSFTSISEDIIESGLKSLSFVAVHEIYWQILFVVSC